MPLYCMSYSIASPNVPTTSGHVMSTHKHQNGRHAHTNHQAETSQQRVQQPRTSAAANGTANGEPRRPREPREPEDYVINKTNFDLFEQGLEDYLIDMLILDCCFETHQEASLLHDARQRVDALDPDPEGLLLTMGYHQQRPRSSDEVVVKCPECAKQTSVKVFANHLQTHNGGGRNSSRTARKRMAEENQHNRLGSSDDESADMDPRLLSPMSNDDDDWQMSKKKKRPAARSRKKR